MTVVEIVKFERYETYIFLAIELFDSSTSSGYMLKSTCLNDALFINATTLLSYQKKKKCKKNLDQWYFERLLYYYFAPKGHKLNPLHQMLCSDRIEDGKPPGSCMWSFTGPRTTHMSLNYYLSTWSIFFKKKIIYYSIDLCIYSNSRICRPKHRKLFVL